MIAFASIIYFVTQRKYDAAPLAAAMHRRVVRWALAAGGMRERSNNRYTPMPRKVTEPVTRQEKQPLD